MGASWRVVLVTATSLALAALSLTLLLAQFAELAQGMSLTPSKALALAVLALAGLVTSHISAAGVASVLLYTTRGGRDGP